MDRERIIYRLRAEAGGGLSETEVRKIIVGFPGKKLDYFSQLSNEDLRMAICTLRMRGFFDQSENMILASSARWWEWIIGILFATIAFILFIPLKILSLIFTRR